MQTSVVILVCIKHSRSIVTPRNLKTDVGFTRLIVSCHRVLSCFFKTKKPPKINDMNDLEVEKSTQVTLTYGTF
jgi:hypothetical protein